MVDLIKLAEELWEARIKARACAPLSERVKALDIETAYRISTINMQRRCSLPGVYLLGKKIGLTAASVQKQLGVGEPDFG